jgi:hypothetical protein
MNSCNTCKHWQRSEEHEVGHSQGLGRCSAARMLWDYIEWRSDEDNMVFIEGAEKHKHFLQDGSDYMAYMLTRPDFGCVSHE